MAIACLIVIAHAGSARAQSTVYAAGSVFLDVQRGSGATSPSNGTLDATVGGGGARLGAFLASRWTLEVDVDASAETDTGFTVGSGDSIARGGVSVIPTVTSPIVISFDERIRTRVTATSVLLGYHPPARGRLGAGFKGGITLLRNRTTETSTTTYTVTDPRLAPLITLPAPSSTTSSGVFFNTAATVSAELAIALASRAAVVPELRTFAVAGRLFVRPGAELRWSF